MAHFVSPTQACQSGYASRLRLEKTSLFVQTRPYRKRIASHVNYAEFEDDFDDGEGSGYGNGSSAGSPSEVKEVRNTELKRRVDPTKHAKYTQEELDAIAEAPEVLVPIRLGLDFEDYKITDFFMWNVNEKVLTPEQFAIITCQDMDLPVGYTNNIASSIKAQLQEYAELASVPLPEGAGMNVIIQLSILMDSRLFEDKFEWDMCGDMTPEQFARIVVTDMGIAGEFYPAIAHALHESLLRQKREYFEGHISSHPANQAAFGLDAGWRFDQDRRGEDWGPTVENLTPEELERREIERERTLRRMKRESARFNAEIELGALSGRFKRRRKESPAVGSPW